jgi:hypothetical protein
MARRIAPVPLLADGRSDEYLVLLRTPSTSYWEFARYDPAFPTRPWRTRTNYPVSGDVIRFLPMPDKEIVP